MERRTRQNQAIWQAIASSSRPLLAQEVLSLAAKVVPKLSIATIYRNLKILQEESIIKTVLIPGQNPRYELSNRVHHHHFQCRQCEKVFDIPSCVKNLDTLIPKNFSLEDHEIILYGRCDQCFTQPQRRKQ